MDLSTLSNEELLALRGQTQAGNAQPQAPAPSGAGVDLSQLSDEQLMALRNSITSKPGPVSDAVQSLGSGIATGAANLIGLPGTIGDLWNRGADAAIEYLAPKIGMTPEMIAETKAAIAKGRSQSAMRSLPTGEQVQSAAESITGPFYKPQTTAGRYAHTVGEMLPAAGRNIVTMGVLPGVASEAAGQYTEGTPIEPYARAGAAVAVGGAGALAARPATAERALLSRMPDNLNAQMVEQAERLMVDAQQRGVRLTWPEAIEQVAPGTGLVNTQRILETTPGGREVMSPFMAQRPAQIDAAARQGFDTIAPPTNAPSMIGPQVGQAAEGTINDVRRSINDATKPFYRIADLDRVPGAVMGQIRSRPGWPEARDAVRNDPQLARNVATLPENSVGFLNEVKKYLDNAAENAKSPVNAGKSMERSAGYASDAAFIRQAGIDASHAYEIALSAQQQTRRQYLEPILQGPLGKLAERNPTTRKAVDALFPKNPLGGSQDEVSTAVSALAQLNPVAARQLVRAHAEATFNKAASELQGGPNQWAGGNFAKDIVGNPQQRANLQAAIEALPNGQQTWSGFERLLEVMQATGKRQHHGSLTAPNIQELKDLSTGSMPANAVKTGTSVGKWTTVISDTWSRWQLGKNLDGLARIITDPQAGPLLRKLADMPSDSRGAQFLAARLGYMALQQSGALKKNGSE